MTSKHQPEHKPSPMPTVAERKRIFLEEFDRTGLTKLAQREANASSGLFHEWLREDPGFRKAFKDAVRRARHLVAEEIKARIAAGEPASIKDRRRVFLTELAAVGVMTAAADAAGLSLRTIAQWVKEERGFREDLHEAKLRFHDRLEMQAVEHIFEKKDRALLRYKLQAELAEKYGRAGSAKARQGLTMDDLERMAKKAQESNDPPVTS